MADRFVATTGNDANDGSSGSPWRTIDHAVKACANGTTIKVSTGTYSRTVLNNVPKSGVTVQPNGNAAVTHGGWDLDGTTAGITWSSGTGSWTVNNTTFGMTMDGPVNNIVFDGITNVDYRSGQWQVGNVTGGMHDLTFRNCSWANIDCTPHFVDHPTSNGPCMLAIYNRAPGFPQNITIEDCSWANTIGCDSIQLSAARGNKADGEANRLTNVTIQRCNFNNVGAGSTPAHSDPIQLVGFTRNVTIDSNQFLQGTRGILCQPNSTTKHGDHLGLVFTNNRFHGRTDFCISCWNCPGVEIVNNTIATSKRYAGTDTTQMNTGIRLNYAWSGATGLPTKDVVLRNNIIDNLIVYEQGPSGVQPKGTLTFASKGNNLINVIGGTYGGTAYTLKTSTDADVRTSNTAMDSSVFISKANGDLRLKDGSPAIGIANLSVAPGTDAVGNPRAASPDAGALEFADATVTPEPDPIDTGTIYNTAGTLTFVGAAMDGTDVVAQCTESLSASDYRVTTLRCANPTAALPGDMVWSVERQDTSFLRRLPTPDPTVGDSIPSGGDLKAAIAALSEGETLHLGASYTMTSSITITTPGVKIVGVPGTRSRITGNFQFRVYADDVQLWNLEFDQGYVAGKNLEFSGRRQAMVNCDLTNNFNTAAAIDAGHGMVLFTKDGPDGVCEDFLGYGNHFHQIGKPGSGFQHAYYIKELDSGLFHSETHYQVHGGWAYHVYPDSDNIEITRCFLESGTFVTMWNDVAGHVNNCYVHRCAWHNDFTGLAKPPVQGNTTGQGNVYDTNAGLQEFTSQGGTDGIDATHTVTNNLTADPLFADPATGDFTIGNATVKAHVAEVTDSNRSAIFPQAFAIGADGRYLRRINNEDTTNRPATAVLDYLLPGADEWSAATGTDRTFGSDPTKKTVQISRVTRRSDGNLMFWGEQWPWEEGTRPASGATRISGSRPYVAMGDANGENIVEVLTRLPGPKVIPAGQTPTSGQVASGLGFEEDGDLSCTLWYTNEQDAVELDNGDWEVIWRTGTVPYVDGTTPSANRTGHYVRTLLKKTAGADTYTYQSPSAVTFDPTALGTTTTTPTPHPEVYRHPVTGVIFNFVDSPYGAWYHEPTASLWSQLSTTYFPGYYAQAVTLPDNRIMVLSHEGGGDEPYLANSPTKIIADRLTVTTENPAPVQIRFPTGVGIAVSAGSPTVTLSGGTTIESVQDVTGIAISVSAGPPAVGPLGPADPTGGVSVPITVADTERAGQDDANSWSTRTAQLDPGTGLNRMLFISAGVRDSGDDQVLNCTFNGVSLTFLGRYTAGANTISTELWYMKDADLPAGGSLYDAVVTLNGSSNRGGFIATIFEGVDQTGAPTAVAATGTGTTATTPAINSSDNELVFETLMWRGSASVPTATADAAQTVVNTLTSGSMNLTSDSGQHHTTEAGAASVQGEWTLSQSVQWIATATPLRQAQTDTVDPGVSGIASLSSRALLGVGT